MNIQKIFKFGLKLVLGFSTTRRRISIYKTLLFNATALGWKGLVKLPVLVYTGTKLYNVGKIVIHTPLERGQIRIGGADHKSNGIMKFINYGTIHFHGNIHICGCSIIENYGTITFGKHIRIGDGNTFLIRNSLTIGDNTRIGFRCFVMDSDDHYTIDTTSKVVTRNSRPISIGKFNWIGNNSYIKKGCKTPDYLIVASANALLMKDYSDFPPYSIVGGAPVKLLKNNIRRIYNHDQEAGLTKYFTEHPEKNSYTYAEDTNLDEICRQQSNIF